MLDYIKNKKIYSVWNLGSGKGNSIIEIIHAFEEAIAIEDQKKFKKNLEDYGKPRKKRQTNRR